MKVFEVLRSQEICITNLEAIQCGVTYAFGLGPQERIDHILCRNVFQVLRGQRIHVRMLQDIQEDPSAIRKVGYA